jgi:hypothetical protein
MPLKQAAGHEEDLASGPTGEILIRVMTNVLVWIIHEMNFRLYRGSCDMG